MAAGDLIDIDVIEGQKENIQALPGGRSAKKLAQALSPKNTKDRRRAEYEAEIDNISQYDDPLDVYYRYVNWILVEYPAAQDTPQSQLRRVLEDATKTFIGADQYKNDPRYLKLWLSYIGLLSDAPRETFVFLSRHGIGEKLAPFYEKYAEWLEQAGRWSQSEEVYKLGIAREAQPATTLASRFREFEARHAKHRDDNVAQDEPSSPALPSVRPALAAKIDPYAAAARDADPQAPRPNMGVGGGPSSKPGGKAKLAIFSDADTDAAAPAMSSAGPGARGWDSIGSLVERKKENVMEPKPWVGETLETGVKKSNGPKMAVFRDPSLSRRIAQSHIVISPAQHQVIPNKANGKWERVFVNLEAVYPTPEEPGTERSFEELWAASRGWLDINWDDESIISEQQPEQQYEVYRENNENDENDENVNRLGKRVAEKLVIHQDPAMFDENGAVREEPKPTKSKKKKVMEVNATQVIKANLDSPSKPKMKKKKKHSSEPTMTMHTKAATDDIYDIFNAPLKPAGEEEQSDEGDYLSDGDYTSGGESTCTTKQIALSEAGDDDDDVDERDATHVSNLVDDHTEADFDPGEDEDGVEVDEDEHMSEEEMDDEPRTRFIPIPPEDWEPPTRPYRDPVEMANNRLPFMTPITERTESSIGGLTDARPRYSAKTPSRGQSLSTPTEEDEEDVDDDDDDDEDDEEFEPMSSPLCEVAPDRRSPIKIAQPLLQRTNKMAAALSPAKPIHKGPIITDMQCNPVDSAVREEILTKMHPPLSSYRGFYDHRDERCGYGADIRRFIRSQAKGGGKSSGGGGGGGGGGADNSPVVLEFPELMGEYTLKRELGAGAFAPVYLVENSSPESAGAVDHGPGPGDENAPPPAAIMGRGAFATSHRASLEALKMEQPPTAWEFHMMRLATTRLGPQHRATFSISSAHELHLYQDEGFLLLPYHPHGTLLDVVNTCRNGSDGVGLDEPLAMFFAVELLRTVEALHSKHILHGDLKPDNCLLRIDPLGPPASASTSSSSSSSGRDSSGGSLLSSQWHADGSGGWASRGVVLIDFGRGIDMRAFAPGAQFVADWKTTAQDCAEMREGRPWTWQIDYHGLAGVIHCLLFGRYMETVRADQGGLTGVAAAAGGGGAGGRRYRVREPLKRYWQTDIWADAFDLLLNPAAFAAAGEGDPMGSTPGGSMPVTRGLRRVREGMERWLEANAERGVGLRGLLARVEAAVKPPRK